jgi:hypothetical protein
MTNAARADFGNHPGQRSSRRVLAATTFALAAAIAGTAAADEGTRPAIALEPSRPPIIEEPTRPPIVGDAPPPVDVPTDDGEIDRRVMLRTQIGRIDFGGRVGAAGSQSAVFAGGDLALTLFEYEHEGAYADVLRLGASGFGGADGARAGFFTSLIDVHQLNFGANADGLCIASLVALGGGCRESSNWGFVRLAALDYRGDFTTRYHALRIFDAGLGYDFLPPFRGTCDDPKESVEEHLACINRRGSPSTYADLRLPLSVAIKRDEIWNQGTHVGATRGGLRFAPVWRFNRLRNELLFSGEIEPRLTKLEDVHVDVALSFGWLVATGSQLGGRLVRFGATARYEHWSDPTRSLGVTPYQRREHVLSLGLTFTAPLRHVL